MHIETQNAIITDAVIDIDDHGILTVWLYLNYGDSGQAFGGYILHMPESFTHYSMQGYAGHFIYRCMEIADVGKWHNMKGKTIRVKHDDSKVYAIGHIVKDDWFNPEEDFKKDRGEAGNEQA